MSQTVYCFDWIFIGYLIVVERIGDEPLVALGSRRCEQK